MCDPIDGSPPGSSVPGILWARTLEWVAVHLAEKEESVFFKYLLERDLLFSSSIWNLKEALPTILRFTPSVFWGVPQVWPAPQVFSIPGHELGPAVFRVSILPRVPAPVLL